MGCLLLLIGLVFPRLAIVVLFFFSNWLGRAFDGVLIPILGFILLPYTMLWYTVVINIYAGTWGLWQILIMVLAVFVDLSSYGGTRYRSRRRAFD